MLVFIDESGHPHPKDAASRPVVVAVCILEEDSRQISRQLFAIKRAILQKEDLEFKGAKLLTRGTFRRRPEKRELTEKFFDICRNLPFTVFATIMEKPIREPSTSPNFLPNQFRYLMQRVDIFAQERKEMAVLVFDGDGSQYSGIATRFNGFIYKSLEGKGLTRITDAPFFVDSRITPCIQIADMAASVIRQYHENRLFQGLPRGDAFLSAIDRYYTALESKTVDQYTAEGYPRRGFYRMPEGDHYKEELLAEDVERQNQS